MKSLHQPNTTYKLVIFDFDGTIADTSPGIIDAHKYTLQWLGKPIPSDAELRQIIGGNLLQTYVNVFQCAMEDAREAVAVYRKRYSQVGIHMAALYPGFEALLQHLKQQGASIGVATLKAENFTYTMLSELGIISYMDVVCGMDQNDKLCKADLVSKCCQLLGVSPTNSVLVGDSNNDATGAQKAGVSFLGVSYGFGFKAGVDSSFPIAESTDEVFQMLSRM